MALTVAALVLPACVGTGSSSDAGGSMATSTTDHRQGRPGDGPASTDAPGSSGAPADTNESPSTAADSGRIGIPALPAELRRGVDECARMAKGPWKQIPYGTDPVVMVRAGRTPEVSTAPDAPILDDIVEFDTLSGYRDPSTLIDPEAVQRAFATAGFREGVAARHTDPDGAEVSVTALRFRDPAAAADAMSAHLSDYCGRAVGAAQRSQGNGMVVVRDSQAVRTFFVLGDVEVSLFVCACYYPNAKRRTLGVQWWADQVEAALLAPEPHVDAV